MSKNMSYQTKNQQYYFHKNKIKCINKKAVNEKEQQKSSLKNRNPSKTDCSFLNS